MLAADTHQPIANARVIRTVGNNNADTFGPPKGATLMIQPVPVMTDADGRFVLESKSVFALFRNAGWWTAPVTYQHAGYETFSTNYTASNVTHQHTRGCAGGGRGRYSAPSGDKIEQPWSHGHLTISSDSLSPPKRGEGWGEGI